MPPRPPVYPNKLKRGPVTQPVLVIRPGQALPAPTVNFMSPAPIQPVRIDLPSRLRLARDHSNGLGQPTPRLAN
jgi:hypothetical protein